MIERIAAAWRRAGRGGLPALALLIALSPLALAETRVYSVEIPEGESVKYEVVLDIEHPGTLVIEAEWSGGRSLALKLQPPYVGTIRRAGSSPLRLETEIQPQMLDAGPWKLSLHAMAMNGAGSGLVTIELPGPPGERKPVPDRPETPAAPEPPPEPWTRPRLAPPGSTPVTMRVFESTERFRQLVVEQPQADSCRWQTDLLQFLANRRDRLSTDLASTPATTGQQLDTIVETIRSIDQLRTSTDPILVGPRPADPELREIWVQVRRNRMIEFEDELDALLGSIQRGHAAELVDEEWPSRLVTCITACQRHFAERGRLGAKRAVNLDLATAQWDRILAAGTALETLAEAINGSDEIVLRSR